MGIAAALVLLLGGAAGVRLYSVNRAVASTVSLDVNPSVEIQVNQKDRVLRVNALNEDGRIVLGDMNFSGSSLDVTVNALVGSMLRNGYLSELANSILVSVDNGDPAKGVALQTRLTEEINSLLQTDAFTGAVLSQTVSADGTLEKLADTYGISLGKAQLIREIADKNPLYTPEDLAKLTINELNLLASAGSGALDKVESVGTASDKAYIGADKARDAALRHAGVTAADAAKLEVELSCEKGVMVYEVEFEAGGYEYDVDVNAKTGDILKSEKERDDDEPTATRPPPHHVRRSRRRHGPPHRGGQGQGDRAKERRRDRWQPDRLCHRAGYGKRCHGVRGGIQSRAATNTITTSTPKPARFSSARRNGTTTESPPPAPPLSSAAPRRRRSLFPTPPCPPMACGMLPSIWTTRTAPRSTRWNSNPAAMPTTMI